MTDSPDGPGREAEHPPEPWGPTPAPPWTPDRATPWQRTPPPPFGTRPGGAGARFTTGRPHTPPPGTARSPRTPDGQPRGRAGLWLGVAGVVLAIVVAPVGIALAMGAVVSGVRNRRLAREAHEATSMATTALTLGVIGLVLGAIMVIVLVAFRSELNAYTDCLSSGNDQSTCTDQLRDAIMHKLGTD